MRIPSISDIAVECKAFKPSYSMEHSWSLVIKSKRITFSSGCGCRGYDPKCVILASLLMGGIEANPGPDHLENRRRVCAVCLLKAEKTKSGYRMVNEHQETMIKEKINAIYSRENLCLPVGLCNPCRLKLERVYVCKRYPDYSKIFKNGSLKWTRERQNKIETCTCKICEVSKASSFAYKKMIRKWKG